MIGQALGVLGWSAQALYQQLSTLFVFRHMNHPILGLSSRRVSLVMNNLTFRTSSTAALLLVSEVNHTITHVPVVALVKV